MPGEKDGRFVSAPSKQMISLAFSITLFMCSFLIFCSFTTYCTFAARCTVNMEEKKILATIEKVLDKNIGPFESLLKKKLGLTVKRLDNMQ